MIVRMVMVTLKFFRFWQFRYVAKNTGFEGLYSGNILKPKFRKIGE